MPFDKYGVLIGTKTGYYRDPLNSQWAASNGIWQDGATIVERADGSYVGFFNKFSTRSFHTDDQGHPI
jgi:uncharacterized protein YukJ